MIATLGRIGWLVVDYYALATAILLAIRAGSSRIKQPARRLALAGPTLAGLLMLAVLVALPGWPRTGPSASPSRPDAASAAPAAGGRAGFDPVAAAAPTDAGGVAVNGAARRTDDRRAAEAPPIPAERPRAGRWPGWAPVVGGAFLAGMAALLGWIGLGAGQLARLRCWSRPAPAALVDLLAAVVGPGGGLPDLRVGPGLRQPLALGARRAAILLPAELAAEGPSPGLRAVLAHEFAHIRHGDLRAIALLRLLLPLLYAHPAYWWLRRRVRDDQEALADAAAAGLGDRLDYADLLLSWSRRFAGPAPLALGSALALFERPSQLRWRITLLLDRKSRVETTCPRAWRLMARVSSAAAVLGLSLLTTRPAAVGQDGPKATLPAADDMPLRGRILNIQGEPVAGATVRVIDILASPTGNLDAWLARLAREREAYPVQYGMLKSSPGLDPKSLPATTTTDRDGRFTIAGVGRERIATLLIAGPGIATTCQYAATRSMPAQKYPSWLRQPASLDVTYHGNDFDLVAGPDLVAVGTVTDADTGRPIAGVEVRTAALFGNPMQTLITTSDADGRYRLAGIAPRTDFGDDQDLLAAVADSAYVPAIHRLKPAGVGMPIALDIRLKRGVELRGRVVDLASGRGVKAALTYYIAAGNPNVAAYPRYGTARVGTPYRTDAEGNFRLAVLPGPGAIGVRAWDQRYLMKQGMETVPWAKDPAGAGFFESLPHFLVPVNYHTVLGIDPAAGAGPLACEVRLDPGRSARVIVVGPDGRPLAGAQVEGLEPQFRSWSDAPPSSAELTIQGLAPDEERDLIVAHEGQNLAGAAVVRAGQPGTVTVRLEPAGAATGRLLGKDGRPMAGVQLTAASGPVDPEHRFGSFRGPVRTDDDGRFRVGGLAPGRKLRFLVWLEGTEPGRRYASADADDRPAAVAGGTVDLGDLTAK